MRIKRILIVTSLVLGHISQGQHHQLWGDLQKGPFNPGFLDTLVFNEKQDYSFQDYNGARPYYVNVWFPTRDTGNPISFDEFIQLKPQIALDDTISQMFMKYFIHFGVTVNLDTWDEVEYGAVQQGLAEAILSSSTHSIKNGEPVAERFPTIIYHHGNGGVPFENSILFEYLASHGFVVVSAYYHWPGLWNRTYHEDVSRPLEDVEFVVAFARHLDFVDPESLHYIGHSWGASVGLGMNHRGTVNFRQYLLFDSTIEHFEFEEHQVLAPTLDSLLRNHAEQFKTKTIDITSRRRYLSEGKEVIQVPRFKPFTYLEETDLQLAVLNEILNHESFTSLGVIKSHFTDGYHQADANTVEAEFLTYLDLVRTTRKILEGQPLESNSILTVFKDLKRTGED